MKKLYKEKPMSAVSAVATGNYHCKLLMTDVTVIYQVHKANKKWNFSQGLGPTKLKFGDILCPPAKRATWYFQIFKL